MAISDRGRRLLRGIARGLLYSLQTLLALLLVIYLLFKGFEREHFRQALPAQIEPAGLILIDGMSGFREGCGVAVWRLSEATAAGLRQQGLGYLQSARQARGYAEPYYRYGPWRATPLSEAQSMDGWLPLGCADAPAALQEQILRGAQGGQGYYSEKDEAVLLVLPAERLIVFAYNG